MFQHPKNKTARFDSLRKTERKLRVTSVSTLRKSKVKAKGAAGGGGDMSDTRLRWTR